MGQSYLKPWVLDLCLQNLRESTRRFPTNLGFFSANQKISASSWEDSTSRYPCFYATFLMYRETCRLRRFSRRGSFDLNVLASTRLYEFIAWMRTRFPSPRLLSHWRLNSCSQHWINNFNVWYSETEIFQHRTGHFPKFLNFVFLILCTN